MIVKIHPLHPITGEMTAAVVNAALVDTGAPTGVFDVVHGSANEVGEQLVRHPTTSAVAFTGSRKGGLALARAAGERSVPIPFYGELGSLNPVVVCPGAWRQRPADIVERLAASILQGYGQFCTSPGLVLSSCPHELATELAARLQAVEPAHMLGERIAAAYGSSVSALEADGVPQLVQGRIPTSPAVFLADAEQMAGNSALREEIFGPACVVVPLSDTEQGVSIIHSLGGQLTGTLLAGEGDEELASILTRVLANVCGRVIWNGMPTGVAVSPAMHHGGPYPATTQPTVTSVGTNAAFRFLRPVCLQDVPPEVAKGAGM